MFQRAYELKPADAFGPVSQTQYPTKRIQLGRGERVVGAVKFYERNFLIIETRSLFGFLI